MDRRFLLGSGLTAMVAALTGGTALLGSSTAALAQDDSAEAADVPEIKEMVLGNEDAPVTLMEYASFTCPHCRDFHNDVLEKVKTEYIDTGKVKFVYRDVYFDRYGLWAAMIARCNPDRFFGIADMFYEQQDQWLRSAKSEAEIADNLRRIGKIAGLDEASLEECLSDDAKARALVAWYQKNATEDDVTGTPTLFVNGKQYSNMSYADLKEILDEQLS